jgi:hypothetical protein
VALHLGDPLVHLTADTTSARLPPIRYWSSGARRRVETGLRVDNDLAVLVLDESAQSN